MMRLDVGSPFVISAMAEHFQRVLSGCAHGPGVVAASRIISSSAIADDTLHVVAMLPTLVPKLPVEYAFCARIIPRIWSEGIKQGFEGIDAKTPPISRGSIGGDGEI